MTKSKIYFKKRVDKFKAHFKEMNVDGFIIENPIDIAYFTGLKLSRGRLLIGPRSTILFVDGRYQEVAKKRSPFPVKDLSNKALNIQGTKKYGFDTALSVAAHRTLKKCFLGQGLKGIDNPTACVRAIKDKSELLFLQKSADLVWKGFLHLKKKLKVGVQEIELAQELEFFVKKLGAEALSFEPIIAFGENSALPHHHSGKRELKKGDVVLMDMGVFLNGYASDMTRTLFFGRVSKRIEEMDRFVKKAHQAAIDICRPGVKVALLDKAAKKAMGKEAKHFIHALGHGIGLETHESPRISEKSPKETLQEGMVITIEPGLYLPGIGGIRHEDMIVITKTGCKNLFAH